MRREEQVLLDRKCERLQNEAFSDLEHLYKEKIKRLQSENNTDYELEDFFNQFEHIMQDYQKAKDYLYNQAFQNNHPTKKKHLFKKNNYKQSY